MKLFTRAIPSSLCLAVALALPSAALAQATVPGASKAAKTVFLQKALTWDVGIAYRSASLRVVGPRGFVHNREFGDLKPVFDLTRMPALADGQYKFELVFGKQPDADLMKAMSLVQPGEDGAIQDPALRSQLRSLREVVAGSFRVEGGSIASPDLVEKRGALPTARSKEAGVPMAKDQVILDDLIVDGSICAGLDCVNGESFGFDTLRLKENNLRIKFEDTSNSASFPSTDWQITANESSNGGLNKFSIEDITASRIPFTIEGSAPSHSLYVDDGGRIGLGTSTPVVELHVKDGDTPTLRLEQDGSSGFTAQTWDVAGNEAGFFVRDATTGSTLPLRIRPGTASQMVDIHPSGVLVGGGTSAGPDNAKLHVKGGVLNLDDGNAVAWGGGTFRPAILGNKAEQYFAMYTAGQERLRVDTSVISFLDATPLAWGTGAARPAIVGNKASNLLTMHINGVERLRADTSGVKITGTLHLNGNPLPDYVFAPGFKLATIEENAAYMWKNRHLPAVGAAKTTADGQGVMDVYSQTRGMLEELEKAHIYIEQLHKEIKALKADAAARDALMAQRAARDAAIEEQLAELRRLVR